LFVNFSQLTGDLAKFSPSNSIKKSHSSSSLLNKSYNTTAITTHMFSKSIEETFYDSNEEIGLILLMKTPSSSLSNGLTDLQLDEDDVEFDLSNPDSIINERKSKKKSSNSNQLSETFVKASFQICILDSNGN